MSILNGSITITTRRWGTLTATRKSFVTKCADPTQVITWTGPNFELTEAQGVLTGKVDGIDIDHNDPCDMQHATTIFNALETANDLMVTLNPACPE
mgnify:CR=1 FL=1